MRASAPQPSPSAPLVAQAHRPASPRRPAARARRLLRKLPLLAAWVAASAFGASAIDGFDFPDAATAERYRALLSEFRCPKCLNESIASSGAPIAVDLRRTVRRLMSDGAGDEEIREHLQARYGDFVLYDPPLRPGTWILWFAPLVLAGGALAVLARVGFRRRAASLTAAEREHAVRMLDDAS